jgi:hypothetical protein
VILVGVVTAVWTVLFVMRVQAHQANVDDYLYAYQSRQLLSTVDFLHTGQTAPLVPMLAMPGVAAAGLYGAMAVELPLLLLLVVGTFVLARTWLPESGSLVAGLVVGLNAGVLGYSVMLHFAVATCAAVVWCLVTYLRSDRFRSRNWSIAFALAFSALLLARSMAPVYAVPLVVVIALDLGIGIVRHGTRPGTPLLAAVVIVLVVAGPWWLASGPAALHYLTSAGYQPSSGYVAHGGALTPATIVQRVKWELGTLGWTESVLLGLALLASGVLLVVRRSSLDTRHLWFLAAWAGATTLILSSSAQAGTAMGLPVIVVLAILCVAVIGQVGGVWIPWALTAVAVVLVAGIVALVFGGTDPWWSGPPYRIDVLAAGGSASTNTDRLPAEVSAIVGRRGVVMLTVQPFLNPNGMAWNLSPTRKFHFFYGLDETDQAIQLLPGATFLLTGHSPSDELPSVDQVQVVAAAHRLGYRPIRIWNLAPGNRVVLWQKGAHSTLGDTGQVTTAVLVPKPGATVSGSVPLVASALPQPLASAVSFDVTASATGTHVVVQAKPYFYGWIGTWNSRTVPDGTYAIVSTAIDGLDDTTVSPPVSVRVAN